MRIKDSGLEVYAWKSGGSGINKVYTWVVFDTNNEDTTVEQGSAGSRPTALKRARAARKRVVERRNT